jgi:hypothetical protein
MCAGDNVKPIRRAPEKAGMLGTDTGKYVKTVRVNGGLRKMIVLTFANTSD